MITATGLTKAFGSRTLLRDADLFVAPRDRVALVGPNGSGKTTLLEMITGQQTPDDGRIDIPKGVRIGYLPQEAPAGADRSALEEVMASAPAIREAGDRLEGVHAELSERPDDEALLAEFSALHDRFQILGGHAVEADARRVLDGLGFSQSDMERSCAELSGGWRMRVALASLLVSAPDVLLLDEPTNHLDLSSVVWLEGFLSGWDGALVLVSHDRDFMNGIVTRVVEIDGAQLISYTGNFEAFVREREARMERQASAAKNQSKRVAEVERFIERFRYKNTKAKQVQSRIKMLDRMERIEAPSRKRKTMSVGFPPAPRSGQVVAELEDVHFSYGDVPVYERLSLDVLRGETIALVGPNGAGKTTLLKLLAGALTPQRGARRLGHNVSCGYFAQHALEALDPRNRLVTELERSLPPHAQVKPRDLLGRFLFSGDDIDKPVSVLSGGERTRLAMAKLLCEPHNFLCLDEPTNHLDMQSRDVLESALVEFTGSIVLITHDRHLIRQIANRVIEVVAGEVTSFPGDYEAFLWHKEQQTQREADAGSQAQAPAPDDTDRSGRRRGAAARDRRREEAEQRAALKVHRDALRRVEAELDRLAARTAELEAMLADPDLYTDGDRAAKATREHGEAAARVSELESEWDVLAAELAEAESAADA